MMAHVKHKANQRIWTKDRQSVCQISTIKYLSKLYPCKSSRRRSRGRKLVISKQKTHPWSHRSHAQTVGTCRHLPTERVSGSTSPTEPHDVPVTKTKRLVSYRGVTSLLVDHWVYWLPGFFRYQIGLGCSHYAIIEMLILQSKCTHHLTSLRDIVSCIVLSLNELGGELVQSLDLLLLSCERLLEVFVLLQQRLHRVEGVADVFVREESLEKSKDVKFAIMLMTYSFCFLSTKRPFHTRFIYSSLNIICHGSIPRSQE